MLFSLKHLCSNKSFSWCPPHHPELWGSGGRVAGDFLVLKKCFVMGWGTYQYSL